MTHLPRVPDLRSQRDAMRKLSFLAGKWTGRARQFRGAAEPVELLQTEEVQFKLDGLILMIEGIGKALAEGQPVLQALGIISYDDESATYRMRAFNDGRFLETELKFLSDTPGLAWGFTMGDIQTKSLLRINEEGAWTELHEIAIGFQPSKKFMEMTVRLIEPM
jgi:hypothetical protein